MHCDAKQKCSIPPEEASVFTCEVRCKPSQVYIWLIGKVAWPSGFPLPISVSLRARTDWDKTCFYKHSLETNFQVIDKIREFSATDHIPFTMLPAIAHTQLARHPVEPWCLSFAWQLTAWRKHTQHLTGKGRHPQVTVPYLSSIQVLYKNLTTASRRGIQYHVGSPKSGMLRCISTRIPRYQGSQSRVVSAWLKANGCRLSRPLQAAISSTVSAEQRFLVIWVIWI